LPAFDEVVAKLGRDRIYRTTGIQFMPLNTLFSLFAQQTADPGTLKAASRLLFIPDLFHFWLSGEHTNEATIASTSQMIDCRAGNWAREILRELAIPTDVLGELTMPGSVIGTLRPQLAEVTGLASELQIVAPATHDTASAVAAVPADRATKWCYLSSGTWSLLGAEIPAPCVSAEAQAASFTNELGVGGTFRFLKNIAGLWLVQECRRDLARQGHELSYVELTRLASEASPLRTLVDPSHAEFQYPGRMLQKIADFARGTNQPPPSSPGEFVRCALESLALAYQEKLLALESILGQEFDVLHIVGGGGRNSLLCQMTADATGRRVVVGPYEATAMGNALVQAMGLGHVRDLWHLRHIVANSGGLCEYTPQHDSKWKIAAEKFAVLSGSK
jgi:rhamnulokinase